MAYVITQNCCNDASCVEVCPVNCIHPTPDEPGYLTAEMLYIDPDVCIDCGACMDACPVGAVEPDFDLSDAAAPFVDLNALYYRDPANQGYDETPATPPRRVRWEASEPLRVAIVGSGPAASYAAAELAAQRGLDVQVDVYERLDVPWGLVRSGVAPDHQSTKAVTEDFHKTMRRRNVRLFLGVEVGRDVTHEQLAAEYNAVVWATGASEDRRLSVPGEEMAGSHSATEFVAWYNGHPDFADRTFDLSHERAVVVGNGNVALDVTRILLSDVDELSRTDIADHALDQLARSEVREVVVVGRRGPAQAAFTTPELLGMQQVPGIQVAVHPDDMGRGQSTQSWVDAQGEHIARYKSELITGLPVAEEGGGRQAVLRFGLSPTAISGTAGVERIWFARNRLEPADGGGVRAVPTGEEFELSCGLVLRSIGYRGVPQSGLPFDPVRGVIPNDGGRVLNEAGGSVLPGLYVTGWIKRGPSGVIGTNRQCAAETVERLLEDFSAGRLAVGGAGAEGLSGLQHALQLDDWNLVDKYERATGRTQQRPRVKLVDRSDVRAVAAGESPTS